MSINLNNLSQLKRLTHNQNIQFVAVTKNREINEILELINNDINLFGENRVQEAKKKFNQIKADHKQISLHLIGPLQSNKSIDALKIFDCIQLLDIVTYTIPVPMVKCSLQDPQQSY